MVSFDRVLNFFFSCSCFYSRFQIVLENREREIERDYCIIITIGYRVIFNIFKQ